MDNMSEYVIQKKTKCDHPVGAGATEDYAFPEDRCSRCSRTGGYVYEEVPLVEALAKLGFDEPDLFLQDVPIDKDLPSPFDDHDHYTT